MKQKTKILIIIPTRNRPDLAKSAIESVLRDCEHIEALWVSDNSNQEEDSTVLKRTCRELDHEKVSYMRPIAPLPMGKHWDWVLQQATQAERYSHVSVLTDRMLFLPEALQRLRALCQKLPNDVISYPIDTLNELQSPYRLNQQPWTGRVLSINCITLAKRQLADPWADELPRLLNCIVPISTLKKIQNEFGTICDAISPDISFGCRLLAAAKSFVRLDQPILLEYGLTVSNGRNISMGADNATSNDFLRDLGDRPVDNGAPIPGLRTRSNCLYHEYSQVLRFAQGASLPQPIVAEYIRALKADAARHPNRLYTPHILAQIEASGLDRFEVNFGNFIEMICRRFSTNLHPKTISKRIIRILQSQTTLIWAKVAHATRPAYKRRKTQIDENQHDPLSYACSLRLAPSPGFSKTEKFIPARCITTRAD